MSRKRFTTLVAVVLLLGAAGLVSLYMTLGRMNAMLRAQGHGASSQAAAPAEGEKIQEMTLTPAGESQLRQEQERARAAQSAPPARSKAPAGGKTPAPAGAPAPAPASSGK